MAKPEPPPTPECDKMVKHTKEWNTIYPFIESLYEKRLTLAKWRNAEQMWKLSMEEDRKAGKEPQYKTLEEWMSWNTYLLENPFPLGLNQLDDLLYEYFGIDPAKLEQERRALLEYQRQLNAQEP